MNGLWERLDPGFFAPIWLLVGFVAMIAVFLLELGARRHRNRAVRLFAAPHLVPELTSSFSTGKRLAKSALLIAATGLLFVALARPHLFFELREESRSGFDLLFAVDCSKSMLSEDVKPSRLERAKLAIADFADHLPDNRLGLIAFAGDAFLQCPLTIDHDSFQTAVRELDTDTIPRPGTDIATAIEQAVLALKSQPNNLKFLILVTDGEDLEGRVLDAAKAAAQSGLKIYTVGVGTANGDLIPTRDDSGAVVYLHDSSGQIVQTKLDESTLRQIASITGGAYEPLGQRGEGLEEIYQRYIAPLPHQHLEEKREKVRFERFEWPLALGLLLLAWEFLLTERAGSGTTPVILPLAPKTALRRGNSKAAPATASALVLGLLLLATAGSARAATIDHAQSDYKKGDYAKALEDYQKAVEKDPDRQDLQYNLGGAAYKAGEFNQAEEAFHKALDTPDLKLQENSYYNLGNAQFKHGESVQKTDNKQTMQLWQQALDSYDASLKLNKTADAQHNYDLVKKKLEQLKQQQQQQQQNKKDSKSDQKDSKDSQQNQDQGQQGGQPKDQDQNQQNQNKDQGDKDQPQQGDKKDQQSQANKDDQKDQNGSKQQQQQASGSQKKDDTPQNGRSESRSEDKLDPGVKSRQEAENLLDSLKDDERHVTARTLNGNNEPPPPPASGKDW
jgi:Ca-activated chloride channel family protein